MTTADFICGMERLGVVECRPQPNGEVLAILQAVPVPGTGRSSRVAFMLPAVIQGRPQQYVDGDLRTRSGATPNNWTTTVVGADIFGTWSFNCPWNPSSDSPESLVIAVLAQWNR